MSEDRLIQAREAFHVAMSALNEAHTLFGAGKISSVQHGDSRQAALVAGLEAMAAGFGVKLRGPLQIDSRGEFSIVVEPSPDADGEARPQMGADFANSLNCFGPRTGTMPGAVMSPESGWCLMNHFSVEKMLREHERFLQAQLAQEGGVLQRNDEPVVRRPRP